MREALLVVVGALAERRRLLLEQATNATPSAWIRVDLTTTHARWCLCVMAETLELAGPDAPFDPASIAWA